MPPPSVRTQGRSSCPDCPLAPRALVLGLLGTAERPCVLQCVTAEAREELPQFWFQRYAFGIVRRGLLVRQTIDAFGERTAVDAAGPGCFVPLRSARGADASAGFAASRLVLCVYPYERIDPRDVDPETLLDLLALSQETVARLERIAAARGRPTATEQVHALVRALSDADGRSSNGVRRPLALKQRDLALLLHIRPETVCRAVRALEAEGVLRQAPEGIVLIDRASER